MKQFDLKEYLANPSRKVVTRDGKNVRILCTDRKGDYPIIALVENCDSTEEYVYSYRKNGDCGYPSSDKYNLFFAPEKHEGWVSIHRGYMENYYCDGIFNSEEKAKERVGSIATVKIEWEE